MSKTQIPLLDFYMYTVIEKALKRQTEEILKGLKDGGKKYYEGFKDNKFTDIGQNISTIEKIEEIKTAHDKLIKDLLEYSNQIELIPIPSEREEVNTKPDIETVLTNLRMLLGEFMAEQDINAANTVYWAEQFIEQYKE